eukprot:12916891-Prorocentrum_lima.AAC.1
MEGFPVWAPQGLKSKLHEACNTQDMYPTRQCASLNPDDTQNQHKGDPSLAWARPAIFYMTEPTDVEPY